MQWLILGSDGVGHWADSREQARDMKRLWSDDQSDSPVDVGGGGRHDGSTGYPYRIYPESHPVAVAYDLKRRPIRGD